MNIKTYPHPRYVTKNAQGQPNGWLVPIFNVHESPVAPAQFPQQVYLTVVAPGQVKGPHLHLSRWGLFTCIKGDARIIVRTEAGYEEHLTGESHGFATVQVPAGIPAALQNIGREEAYILNMPAPAWRPDAQDEHDVSFADYDFTWPRTS
ncbi:MAG: WxcM-like domain-containing protein [Opitutaceae bacterium]|nr:WxcM-like domain-containing protein [Opitutaceae bacterium]